MSTTPRTDTMDPNKQRIAIAEYCGWTNCRIGSPGAGGAVDRPGRPVGTPPNRKYTCELPNYTGCLNAMHEAEKVLSPKYQEILDDSEWGEYLSRLGFCGENTSEVYGCVTATAAQRAEAFLRTIGKWQQEGQP